MDNNYILEMKNISKSFGGLKALSDVNLELRRGEIIGLVGDNGAGKSTLMKILTGAYHPDKGRIIIEGREVVINSPRVSKKLGIEMVYQNLELCQNLDVASNLFLGRETVTWFILNFLKKKEMEQKAIKILKRLKIDIKNPKIRIDRFSGGQQQAVAIGKAVSFNPKILIMDEPTASLAVKEIDEVLELIIRLRNHGISVIFISHRLDDVFKISDRIFVLKGGKRIAIKNTKTTNKDEIVRLMFVGRDQQLNEIG